VALHILCYRAEKVGEATEEMDGEHSRGCREKRMQHITNRRKVEGQDLIERMHPAPLSYHFIKDGQK